MIQSTWPFLFITFSHLLYTFLFSSFECYVVYNLYYVLLFGSESKPGVQKIYCSPLKESIRVCSAAKCEWSLMDDPGYPTPCSNMMKCLWRFYSTRKKGSYKLRHFKNTQWKHQEAGLPQSRGCCHRFQLWAVHTLGFRIGGSQWPAKNAL